MLSRRYLLFPLIVVFVSACNGGGDSAGSPQKGLASTQSLETLGSLNSLSGFALSFDNRSSAEMSEKLKLAQSEMDRVQLVSSEELSEIRNEQLLLEKQQGELRKEKSDLEKLKTSSFEGENNSLVSMSDEIKSLELKRDELGKQKSVTRERISRYEQELSNEIKSLSDERSFLSDVLLFFGYDTHKDDREKIEKDFSEKLNVDRERRDYAKLNEKIAEVDSALEQLKLSFDKKQRLVAKREQDYIQKQEEYDRQLRLIEQSLSDSKERSAGLQREYDEAISKMEPEFKLALEVQEYLKLREDFVISITENKASLRKLVELSIYRHYIYHKSENPESEITLSQVKQKIDEISEIIKGKKIEESKVIYEAYLEELSGRELVYNKNSENIIDVILQGKLQCSSGTMLFLLAQLTTDQNEHLVVIQRPGHILPGFIKLEDGKRMLYGVETTASGPAIQKFGHTEKISGEIRVIDAKQYLAFDLLSFESTNRSQSFDQMMSYSAQSLGFKPEQFVKLDRRQFERQEEMFESALNSSPLSFGHSDVEFGDISRKPVSTDDLTRTFEKVSSSLNESEEALVDTSDLGARNFGTFSILDESGRLLEQYEMMQDAGYFDGAIYQLKAEDNQFFHIESRMTYNANAQRALEFRSPISPLVFSCAEQEDLRKLVEVDFSNLPKNFSYKLKCQVSNNYSRSILPQVQYIEVSFN